MDEILVCQTCRQMFWRYCISPEYQHGCPIVGCGGQLVLEGMFVASAVPYDRRIRRALKGEYGIG